MNSTLQQDAVCSTGLMCVKLCLLWLDVLNYGDKNQFFKITSMTTAEHAKCGDIRQCEVSCKPKVYGHVHHVSCIHFCCCPHFKWATVLHTYIVYACTHTFATFLTPHILAPPP